MSGRTRLHYWGENGADWFRLRVWDRTGLVITTKQRDLAKGSEWFKMGLEIGEQMAREGRPVSRTASAVHRREKGHLTRLGS